MLRISDTDRYWQDMILYFMMMCKKQMTQLPMSSSVSIKWTKCQTHVYPKEKTPVILNKTIAVYRVWYRSIAIDSGGIVGSEDHCL